jgi:hypothetical protein
VRLLLARSLSQRTDDLVAGPGQKTASPGSFHPPLAITLGSSPTPSSKTTALGAIETQRYR